MVVGWVVDKGGIGEFLMDVANFSPARGESPGTTPNIRYSTGRKSTISPPNNRIPGGMLTKIGRPYS